MKIKELIKIIRLLPKDMEVQIHDPAGYCIKLEEKHICIINWANAQSIVISNMV